MVSEKGLMNITALGIALQSYKLCTEAALLRLFKLLQPRDCEDKVALIERLNNLKLFKELLYPNIFEKGLELIHAHSKASIEVISIFDPRYPKPLIITSRPPALLYVRGNSSLLEDAAGVAVVGSREVSTAGAEITRRIVNKLVAEKFYITSGLAIGVDSAAHRAAVAAKGKTIAVLAHGLEEAKPKQNARLGHEILDYDGAWVSEFPMGRNPSKPTFVQRNRIQVGLSAGSVIVEAALKSGSITQAEFCNQERRPLFCVVPEDGSNKLNLNCEGTLLLVKENLAYPLRTKKDYEHLVQTMNNGRATIINKYEMNRNVFG
ncbi:DNA-processing protein DprA [Alteromonas macleodii]|uniref:DNA-processing protein DprA n=1 Tax=Alteromonas macleodii TaxID=28108 RepID=UPI002FE1EA60